MWLQAAAAEAAAAEEAEAARVVEQVRRAQEAIAARVRELSYMHADIIESMQSLFRVHTNGP